MQHPSFDQAGVVALVTAACAYLDRYNVPSSVEAVALPLLGAAIMALQGRQAHDSMYLLDGVFGLIYGAAGVTAWHGSHAVTSATAPKVEAARQATQAAASAATSRVKRVFSRAQPKKVRRAPVKRVVTSAVPVDQTMAPQTLPADAPAQ